MQSARTHRIRMKLKPSEDNFDHLKETEYCIEFSKQHFESKKKQSFLNKCSFDYSLQKINKEKQTSVLNRFFGNLIPFTTSVYPATMAQGRRFTQFHYSSDIVKGNRKRLLSDRYSLVRNSTMDYHKDQMRKVKGILSRKKNQQGGIDSFWIFKKDPVKEEKKKPKGQANEAGEQQAPEDTTVNRTEQAFIKLLQFAKLPLQIENSLVARNIFKNYISSIFGETFTLWFINFYQIKAYLNFKEFEAISQRFQNISIRECHMMSFFLYDDNGDGVLCPRDLFAIFQRQLSLKIDRDILRIGDFVKKNLQTEVPVNEQYKIQSVCIRDDWLTVKDYEMYFKKVDEPYLKATNKKDTVFSKSFAVLDHRQKVRSKRREMNEKKNFYEELYGEISKMRKREAYIDSLQDYKLNFSLLVQIYGNQKTELYQFFAFTIFGIEFSENRTQ